MMNHGMETRAPGMRLCLLVLFIAAVLTGCRGEEVDDPLNPSFPVTANPGAFIEFLNPAPGQQRAGAANGEIDNVKDFPEAYYNTIDPNNTRDSFDKWRMANGFLNADGSEAECNPATCVTAHVKFRDVKDLGYGRNMFMRRDLASGNVAVYVENFQVDSVPGVPYGPLNLEALVDGQRQWNFGVNAIEYSAFPATAPGAPKYTKFYNFVGDGGRSMLASGSQVHFVDLDDGGEKPMPSPCIVCHGGHGRTLVVEDERGEKRLAPTITGGVPGDVQAHMQIIEQNTLQFATNSPGFREVDNADGIRLINDAVLSTYLDRQQNSARTGDWNPAFAIEIIQGRYRGDAGNPNNEYDPAFVPSGWASADPALYQQLVGRNCIVCHQLRGSGFNAGASLATANDFRARGERIHQLVFQRGRMPSGLLNYADFWESGNTDPAAMAAFIGHPEVFDEVSLRAQRPGVVIASMSAPLMATGFDSRRGDTLDVPMSGRGSAFVADGGFRWSVVPEFMATIVETERPGEAVLRARSPGEYTVTLQVDGENGGSDSMSLDITVLDAASETALPAADDIRYYGSGGIAELIANNGCLDCHSAAGGLDGIPLYYEACQAAAFNGHDFVYRSVLARVNFATPADSLFLRKPTNGATDLSDLAGSEISGYHQGGAVLDVQDTSRILAWILSGAPRGALPTEPVDEAAPNCIP